MVSSFALAHRNERTVGEMLRIHPDEHPVSIQLFGPDPEVMREAAGLVADAGADLLDLNMGCPVPKVCKTGAGAALLADPERALAVARAAAEGSGLPVTVKLRSGAEPGDRSGVELALRLVEEAGVAAIAFHPRAAAVAHRGEPDYELARELAERLPVPMIVSGGLSSAESARRAYEASGADAVMIARGALGYPWIFAELTGRRTAAPEAQRDRRRAALGARPGRVALGSAAGGAQPAQALPVVPGAPRPHRARGGRLPAHRQPRTRCGRRSIASNSGAIRLPGRSPERRYNRAPCPSPRAHASDAFRAFLVREVASPDA